MADERVTPADNDGLGGDDAAEQDREFGHGDQQFGGGVGDEEYGDAAPVDETGEPVDPALQGDAEERARSKAVLADEEE